MGKRPRGVLDATAKSKKNAGSRGTKRAMSKAARSKDGSPDDSGVPGEDPPTPPQEFSIDAILHEKIVVERGEVEQTARRVMEDAMDEADNYHSDTIPIWGNKGGRDILRRMAELEAKVKENEAKAKETEAKVNEYDSATFRIRSRWFETYRRDVLRQDTDQSTIQLGNETAHEGDSVRDSRLFESGYRKDAHLLLNVYRLNLAEIIRLRDRNRRDIINAIDTWATLEVRRHEEKIPETVENAFDHLITVLRKDFDKDETDSTSGLGEALAHYWYAHKHPYGRS